MTAPVLITGCHRGGTSALARALGALGLQLGPPSELKPAAPDNPDGFWEHAPLVAVSDALLAALGGGWDCPPELRAPVPSTPALDKVRAMAREALAHLEGSVDAGPWGWKDPRLCVTLPFWLELLPESPIVMCIRNPLEVAVSLHERNGVSYAFGLQLWAQHHRRAMEVVPAERRILVHYDALLSAEAAAQLRRLAVAIGAEADEEQVRSAVAAFEPTARHTRLGWQDLHQVGAGADLRRAYDALRAEAGWSDDGDRAVAGPVEVRIAALADLGAEAVGAIDSDALDRLVLTHRYHRRGGRIAILERRILELEQADGPPVAADESVEPDGVDVDDLLAEFERSFHRSASLLDWHSGLGLYDRLLGRDVMLPPVGLDALPHADRSVDLVAIGSYEPALLAEAARVAKVAVLVGLPHGDPAWSRVDVRWHEDLDAPARPRLSVLVCTSGDPQESERVAELLSGVPAEHAGEVVPVGPTLGPSAANHPRLHLGEAAFDLASAFDRADGDVILVVDEGVRTDGDWVTPMLRLLAERDDLGAVIARVVEGDRLVAAGAELRSDASLAYLAPPDGDVGHPDAGYVRTTDLHGGSALAVRRSSASQVGGIATGYDTVEGALVDLGLALQGAGWGVLLQPECTVRGRVLALDGDVLGVDRARLVGKWAPVLSQRVPPARAGEG